MKVFKFGGASVKDADSVKNMASIIEAHNADQLMVIVSAMGKMTNAFEAVLQRLIDEEDYISSLQTIKDFHAKIIADLGLKGNQQLNQEIQQDFENLSHELERFSSSLGYDYLYDQTVSFGEILSTRIVSAYLNTRQIKTTWLDARKLVKTDNIHRQAKVDWGATQNIIRSQVAQHKETKILLTQGFIGSNAKFNTTTLGREGSDFSAAILPPL